MNIKSIEVEKLKMQVEKACESENQAHQDVTEKKVDRIRLKDRIEQLEENLAKAKEGGVMLEAELK